MKRTTLRKTLIAAALVGATALGASALAHGYGPGWGMGPGMMGGYGPGTGGGYGPGYGMGPGMMGGYGGYGMGPGMMGGYGPGYGMGPGMMGGYGPGYGMGPGMMWGYGPGYGTGSGPALNLSDEQRSKIDKIQEDTSRKQWELMSKMQEEQGHLNELFYSDKRDDAAISKTYKKVSELRQQMFDNSLAARKQVDGVLTKEQREQLRHSRYGMGAY
jgi:Spy/CpxP family protein refolding chaperone